MKEISKIMEQGIFTEEELSYLNGSDRISRFLEEGFEITSVEERELMFPTTCYVGRARMKVLFFQKGDEKRTALVHMDQMTVFSRPLSYYERFTRQIAVRADLFSQFFTDAGLNVGNSKATRTEIEKLMQIRCMGNKGEVAVDVPICCEYVSTILLEAKKEDLGERFSLDYRLYVCGKDRQSEALWDCLKSVSGEYLPDDDPEDYLRWAGDSLKTLLDLNVRWPATYIDTLVRVLLHVAHAMEVKEGKDDGGDRLRFRLA